MRNLNNRDRRRLDLEMIRSLYVVEGWSHARIAEQLGVSKWTIRSRLNRLGISAHPPKIDPAVVRELYVEKNWSPTQIAKQLKVATSSVRSRLSCLGLLSVRPRLKLELEKIRELYFEKSWSQRRIAIHFGVSAWSIAERLKQFGIHPRPRPRSVLGDKSKRDAVIRRIKDLYLNEGLTVEQIARRLRISNSTVSRLLKNEGVDVPRRPKRDLKEILRLYVESGWTADRIAERFGTTTRAIFHEIFKSGVTRRSLRPKLDPAKIREMYVDQELTVKRIAELFQVGQLTIYRVLDAENIERRPRGSERRKSARHFDPRLANLEVGESFQVQCLDPVPVQVYFSRQAKNLKIRIATRRTGATALQVTRYE